MERGDACQAEAEGSSAPSPAGEGRPEQLALPLLTVPGRVRVASGTLLLHAEEESSARGWDWEQERVRDVFQNIILVAPSTFLITQAGLRQLPRDLVGYAGWLCPIGTPLPLQGGDVPRVVPYCSQPTQETPLGNEGPSALRGTLPRVVEKL